MKLYMKQKVFSWADRFTVKDAFGNDCYYVQGKLFSWGKQLFVYDAASGAEAAFIKQKVFSFLPRYEVYVGGAQVLEIVKEFTFLRPRYTISGKNWDVQGDFFAHEYSVTQNGAPVVAIAKEWLSWGDTYAIDIASPADEIAALATVLAIDCAVAQQNN
ncbi:MAG: LURP-one-related family protein [Clostridiaceae bacterium]|nr:LURP-one-related family protein [Eubacteriales bacterium]